MQGKAIMALLIQRDLIIPIYALVVFMAVDFLVLVTLCFCLLLINSLETDALWLNFRALCSS